MRMPLNFGAKLASALFVLALMTTSASAQFTLNVSFLSGSGAPGNMFDMTCTAPIMIDSFDVHQNLTNPLTYEVYYKTSRTSYIGSQLNAADWTLLGTATNVVGAGAGLPTPLNLNLGFTMNPGETIGFYVTSTTTAVAYTIGNAVGNVWASDSFLTVYEGHGGGYPFNMTFSPRNFNGNVHYTVITGNTDDMACGSVDGPADAVGCSTLSNSEAVTFTASNFGSNTILAGTNFTADLIVDGNFVTTEIFTVTNDLVQFATEPFTFVATGDFSAGGTINADVTITYGPDQDVSNDSASRAVIATGTAAGGLVINTYPFSENFDLFSGQAPLNGFIQDFNDSAGTNGNWFFGSSTGSSAAGPETNGLGDHTSGSGKFAFIEDSTAANPIINLLTPCLDLTGLSNPHVRVWVNAHDYSGGTEFNAVDIDLLTAGGVVPSVGGVYSDTGDAWQQVLVSLAAYAGQTIQIQFRSTNTNSSFHCDSSIDDVEVIELTVQNGQAPQAGLASLDINSAVNGNGATVTPGTGGPFSASATAGSAMAFSMEGEANQGILLVGGPLNVQVATFPGFGQMDIGTLPLDPNGIPGGLFLWGDGVTAPVLGVNTLFNTSASGSGGFSITTPVLPLGVFTTFQLVVQNTINTAAISNAVELIIN